jgi:exopolyphosphatase
MLSLHTLRSTIRSSRRLGHLHITSPSLRRQHTTMSSRLPHTPLNHFLREARTDFLANAAHSSAPLRVVMGNEAGDLDSLVCAIAFSYLSYHRDSKAQRWYPLVQTERQDFKLRAENQLALKTCLIDEDHIISLDDWTRTVQSEEAPEIALVDHCKLAARWKPDLTVKAVIDQ